MKNQFVLLFIMLTCALSAQEKVENIGDFTEVKVFDRMRVNLIKSDENKVILKGRDTEDIELVNKDGILKIRMDIDKIFDGNETFVEVYFNNLKVIDGNEGAEININELLEQDEIEIRVQEGARVTAGIDVESATLRAVTGGIIRINGSARSQNVEINTGGIYNGKNLETTDTQIRIQAGGEAEIFARRTADIKLRAGGDVYVYGNPTELIKDKFIGGRVRLMNN
ncbi:MULTISPECIES: head GIN domain-containing protein [unclassified Leeuwenhoekiella]|uniref:head GIN domain-containing protein n=1 Tax=unclassified Leeuwenhoekiella TaxID=2615029 RepID=UPI000C55212D|nr:MULTISPECIES: head GIN domain-containing protein [unclassified Leeuwenhoekiella]MAW95984.1 chaperonin [Leeuwenhoekiella sp.]MBA79978.1 chaperonin [Leeuwenhoekiella sp.]|tara:strand:- start:23072 stop:23746 length:675 start_codon:yes stop_codon:yes gene_type:complete